MNILYLAIIVMLIVATLSFLMPWVSKKIEEPFAGCADPAATTVTIGPLPTPASEFAQSAELGRQKYNFLGFLQDTVENKAFTADQGMGSIDNTPPAGGGDSPLTTLNKNIRRALETVHILPRNPELIAPLTITTDATGKKTVAPADFNTYIGNATTKGAETDLRMGYVEERLPPNNEALKDAARCEVNNMYYQMNASPGAGPDTYAESVVAKRDRYALCEMLDKTNTNPINNAFPTNPNKICGVCIKNAQPFSPASVYNPGGKTYNGIGGMFVSQGDLNLQGSVKKPSYGTCAEGYFFLPNEHTQCMAAAQKLNCEELGIAGGFQRAGAKSEDDTAMASSNCFACTSGTSVHYAYSTPPATHSVRVRIVVPTGTGRTTVQFNKSGSNLGTVTITSVPETTLNTTLPSLDGSTNSNMKYNTFYYILSSVSPDDTFTITANQEFPHRPYRDGIGPEVFFVAFQGTEYVAADLVAAKALAESLDCTVATKDQLILAQQQGLQVCNVGIAVDGKNYVVRKSRVSASNPFSGTGTAADICATEVSKGGVSEATAEATATGVWCYGIKPVASHIQSVSIGGTTITPSVSNFYNYYKQDDTSTISDTTNMYSGYGLPPTAPNYRGICIQLERNSTELNQYESINVPVENFITNVNGTAVVSATTTERLKIYSRNGRFNDSERILTPKPTSGTPFSLINQNQYWLWSPHEGTTQSPTFSVSFKIPGYFAQPTFGDTHCNSSVLYTSKDNLELALNSACMNGLDEYDDSGCMESIFKYVGGTNAGTLYPNTAEKRKQLFYADYPTNLKPRTQEQLMTYLMGIKELAMGQAEAQRFMTEDARITSMNTATQQLIGGRAVGPCETVKYNTVTKKLEKVNKPAPLDARCLDSLYNKKDTYGENVGNAYSGLDTTEFPYRTCQPTGTWAPIQNGAENKTGIGAVLAEMSKISDADKDEIQKAIAVFNKIHEDANSSLDAAIQETAIERCYGIQKKKFKTNCVGVNATALYIYDLAGNLFGTKDGVVTVNNSVMPSESQSDAVLNTYTSPIPTTNVTVQSGITFPLTPADILNKLFIQKAEMKMGGSSVSVTDIAKGSVADGKVLFVLSVTERVATPRIKMVGIEFSVVGNNLRAKSLGGKYRDAASYGTSLITFWGSLSNAPTAEYSVINMTFGFVGSRYVTPTPTPTNALSCIGDSSNRIYGMSGITDRGCTTDCCELYAPYFTLNSSTETKSVTLNRTQSTSIVQPPLIVLLKDAESVVAQKMIQTAPLDTDTTVNFLTNDVVPLVAYNDILMNPSGATTILRLESAVGEKYFMTSSNASIEYTTNTTGPETRVVLTPPIGSSVGTFTLTLYNTQKILVRKTDNTVEFVDKSVTSNNANTNWAIKPALNGAYAYVSIELANIPGYYLVTERQANGSYMTKVKVVDPNNDVDTFLASWRLYPVA